MSGPVLAARGLRKSFGAVVAADDVNIEVPRGQRVSLIGSNGAGKTTFVNMTTGYLKPDSGTISLDGTDVTRRSPREITRLGVARSFQIPQPFDGLTVFENLLTAAAYGRGKTEAQVADDCAEVLRDTGLLARANQIAGSLSLLDRKRLELARAMATGPELLLLDEIAGGLTDGECKALIDTIKGLHAQGTTIIWIEHVLHCLLYTSPSPRDRG